MTIGILLLIDSKFCRISLSSYILGVILLLAVIFVGGKSTEQVLFHRHPFQPVDRTKVATALARHVCSAASTFLPAGRICCYWAL